VWQRKWLILAPLVLTGTAAVMYSRSLPDMYRSETTILVVPQRVPESYVRSTVTMRIQDQLQSLRQQILSRVRLEQIIRDFNLYPEARRTEPMEAVVAQMRPAVNVDIVREDAFSVNYTSTDPTAAKLVAERLASMFIEENLRERERQAEGTSEFLETQLESARERLEQHERTLAQYRRRYSGELPSQLDSNVQMLNSLQVQAQGIGNDLDRDRDRVIVLDRMIEEMAEPIPVVVAARGDSSGTIGPTGSPGPPGSAAERLAAARAALDELRTRLKPEHPDVAAARRLVAELERKAEAEAAAATAALAAAAAAAAARSKAQDVPPPQLTVADVARQRRLQELVLEKENLDRQIARKQQEEARIRQDIALYQARLQVTPTRESELIDLTRDYETLKAIYTGLLAKKEDSVVAANLERRQIGEQFKILDPARVPQRPFSPNRMQLNLFGALAGLAFGVGIAGFLEYRDATLKNEDDVRTCLSLQVVAAIPILEVAAVSLPRQRTFGAFRLAQRLIRGGTRES
jgi:polysaccharide chain length determinant protein (PEP-CTERM system associated)